MARRSGSVTSRGPSTWRVRVFVGRDEGGRRQYLSRTVKGTKRQADEVLAKMQTELAAGTYVEPVKQTVNEYLDAYLEAARVRVRPRTHDSYSTLLKLYVRPELGRVALTKLTSEMIQRAYGQLQVRGLSARTIRYAHSVLNAALRQAQRRGHLGRNPAEMVDLPREDRQEMRAMSASEASRFLAAADGDRWHPLFLVAITSGMRPGELLGLRWGDVSLDSGVISVQRTLVLRKPTQEAPEGWQLQEPKTSRGRRVIKLPAAAIQALRTHRAEQNEERLAAGPGYQNHDLVFAGSEGKPLHYRNLVRRHFKPVLRAAGLPEDLRLYDLRHTCATLLLQAGENPKVVAERLGHASVTLTLDTYSHVLPDMQQRAAERLQEVLFDRPAK